MIERKIQKGAIKLPASALSAHKFGANRPNYIFETGFFCKNADLFLLAIFADTTHDRSNKHPLCQIAWRDCNHRVESAGAFLGKG
ncbi:hypothetical protein GEV39_19390 [Pseudomonas sp. NY5710]|nr:hypothetical protein GEV39_19390 [Pseudomonas sp. NY5710]